MNQFRMRLIFVIVLLATGSAVVIGRLFTIQVLEGKRYAQRSSDQTHQRTMVQARRGSLVDRFGRTLAISMQNMLTIESEELGVNGAAMKKMANVKRVYPLGDVAGSLLGYVGTDGNGLGGAEFAFDRYLRGEDGWTILQKDGRNRRYRKIGLPEKAARNGYDVALTIDINIQKIAQGVLRQSVAALQARGGMCIVMDPGTGAILAMADEPSFNPNLPGRSSMVQRQNRCISALYEPGSTFKLVAASVALQENLKNENDLIFGDNGSYRVYDQVIRDHTPYGYLTFAKALTYSSNICFAKVANDIGNERFYRYVRDFGFGTRTSIDLPGEECGIVHPVKEWSGRTRVTMAMGQEVSATLLQMMLPYAAVANGGVLVSPRIVEKVVDAEGAIVDSGRYTPVRRVLSEEVAARLRLMLKDVVDNGTGKNASVVNLAVAGKTGTSQKPDSGGYSKTRQWSSFIGFAPVNAPQLLCGIVIDEPAGNQMGGEAAAPPFRKIFMQILSHPELEFAEKMLQNSTIPQRQCTVTRQSAGALPPEATQHTGGVPSCVGQDLRDAVNLINSRGLRPYAVGCGLVHRQAPAAGTIVKPAAACTLYCSLEG